MAVCVSVCFVGPSLLLFLLAGALSSNSSAHRALPSGVTDRRLGGHARRDMQREILSIMGLPQRPRPRVHEKRDAAPAFMLNLYNAISTDDQEEGSQVGSVQEPNLLKDTDMVMSFISLACSQPALGIPWTAAKPIQMLPGPCGQHSCVWRSPTQPDVLQSLVIHHTLLLEQLIICLCLFGCLN
ncbi:bone morphogenetic protein 7-like [Arapaima gigas]